MPPRKHKNAEDQQVTDYRHSEKRKNIPPAGLAAQGRVREIPKTRYEYDPHLPPILRFDPTGGDDCLPELLETARQRPLTKEEAKTLAEALRNRQPWLEWAGKREKTGFDVDPVALHIHERVSTQAILKLAQREPLQRWLFADPELEYQQAIQFYQHDVDWANRLILGDSLTVMNSLAHREDLAGKVQMVYIDPPYGIKFASNFQPQVAKRDVKEREDDLTREPEQIKAYRDTWALGVHSYLSYLSDRFLLAKELLADSGSIFVQISDENHHRVRLLLDAIFGPENFCSAIVAKKTGGQSSVLIPRVYDTILWYAKKIDSIKYRPVFYEKKSGEDAGSSYTRVYLGNGVWRAASSDEIERGSTVDGEALFSPTPMTSDSHGSTAGTYTYDFQGKGFQPPNGSMWKTTLEGQERLRKADRVVQTENSLRFVRYLDDFPASTMTSIWDDLGAGSFTEQRLYVVQTRTKIIQRCMLMTTDPGDLVLDPTCGSGTTAYVAEQWGRRWLTIDTSRVALALARQRLLTAKYDFYELSDANLGPSSGFNYKTVPHIALKSIAQNRALDPVFAKYEPILGEKLATLNKALSTATPDARAKLARKLDEKERRDGKSAITEADRRRWLLPKTRWEEWEVPFDTDPDWADTLKQALEKYRKAWRQKMDEVNATIAASAPQETLVDQPHVVPSVVRVSGPFTVEGVQPVEETLDLATPIGGEPEELSTFNEDDSTNAEAYLEKMIRLLRQDGVRFPDNKIVTFTRLEPLPNSILHAEGEWGTNGNARRVAVSFGPQYGPLTAKQVEECLRTAYQRGYDDLVFTAFTIDGAAQAIIQDDPNPNVHTHMAHIRPDVQMGDLLKDTPGSQLFTVFGLPRAELQDLGNGECVVEMQGVDIYDPVTNTLTATRADKVAAWFLDSDYDGRTFCITQAFFPDKSAWEKLAKALKTSVDPERFAAFSSTKSLPFTPGENGRIAVKVIDPRGNEVLRVLKSGPAGRTI